jgi:uncharacterized protein YndB with AHSA1/START domain
LHDLKKALELEGHDALTNARRERRQHEQSSALTVTVKAIEPNRRILIEWPGYGGPTTVEWTFKPVDAGSTFVSITNSGFTGEGDALVKQATDSTQGFTLVPAGLKAWLEHGVALNLVADRYPKGVDDHA